MRKAHIVLPVLTVTALLLGYAAVREEPAAFGGGQAGVGQPATRQAAMGMQLVGDHMQMLEATTADSFTPQADPLAESGWTAAASDQQSGYPASFAIDGNSDTFWHSEYSPRTMPLPHSITIDMHAVHWVSGLTYLPRQDGVSNGFIGRYSISVSRDGKHWGSPVATGTWADDSTLKTAVFGGVFTQYVRLTALTEAGNSGPYTSVAELTLLGEPSLGPALPRNGWTVSADSQAGGYPAKNVLDGDGLTIWSTAFSGAVPPLPHYITINMHGTHTVSGLEYLPRQDGNDNGNIGRYSISVSANGRSWGKPVATGTWTDDESEKYAVLKPRSARYVRLTALTEAGDDGPWTSAAEINVLGVAPSVGTGGKWSAPIGFPIVPVSAVVLPNDKLLTFSADNDMSFDKTPDTITDVAVLDLKTGKVSEPEQINTHDQMFCEGLAMLPDGRVLINGGSNDRATTIYNPYTNKWTVGPLMNIPRAYEGDTTLSTGQVLTLGGSWYDSAGDKNGEIFTAKGASGSWRKLPGVLASAILTDDPAGVFRADNHVWLFAQANGTVFQAGPSKEMHWITTKGNGTIKAAGRRSTTLDEMNGNAVMYGPGKILAVGGATAYQDAGSVVDVQATRRATTINISGGPGRPVKVARTSEMAYARAFSNSVVLPNGEVLVVGGQQHPEPFTDTGAVLSPELWNPATGKFTVMAPEVIPRNYHSVAILLPDGRVFSGGGGLCGDCTTNHPDGQIFSPPYLFNRNGTLARRPVIKSAPSKARTGRTITVTTNSATPRFALIRMAAVTHSLDNDQRLIPVTPSAVRGDKDKYRLRLPASTGVLLPGNYMLFALNAKGTPSVAKVINIQ
jgi:galactose oxidase